MILAMSQEQRPEKNIWDQALEGVDFSKLDKGKEGEYPTISPREISEAYETYPLKGDLMRLANENLKEARAQAEGAKPRERKTHDMGWELAIETPQGLVGLWSCWLGNQFYLGFPKSTSSVVDSVDAQTVISFGNHLRMNQLSTNAPWWQRKPLDYQGARGQLEEMSDPELRETLRLHRVPFRDVPYIPVTDELIMQTLGAERAKAVRQVNATAVNDPNYKGEFADPDKPLEQNRAGQIVGYQDVGERQWAKFYGPMEPTGGRVWVDYSGFHSNGMHFPYIDEQGQLQSLYYGHDRSNGIYTDQFSFYNQYAPEGPTADPEAIQKYRDKFIRLAAEIAFIMGGPKAVNIDYGYSMVPEDLYREGYEDIIWLKGDLGERKGWGNEIVRGRKGDGTVVLKSANSLVPWSTTLRAPIRRLASPTMLADFIKEDILWF